MTHPRTQPTNIHTQKASRPSSNISIHLAITPINHHSTFPSHHLSILPPFQNPTRKYILTHFQSPSTIPPVHPHNLPLSKNPTIRPPIRLHFSAIQTTNLLHTDVLILALFNNAISGPQIMASNGKLKVMTRYGGFGSDCRHLK
jgi:hypothetical protein